MSQNLSICKTLNKTICSETIYKNASSRLFRDIALDLHLNKDIIFRTVALILIYTG